MSTGPRIEVVIDRLVVRGTTRAGARAVERDLQARLDELARGWLDGSVPPPPTGDHRPRRDPVVLGADDRGATLGSRVAEAVFTTVQDPGTGARRNLGETP